MSRYNRKTCNTTRELDKQLAWAPGELEHRRKVEQALTRNVITAESLYQQTKAAEASFYRRRGLPVPRCIDIDVGVWV
jgi:hypothetical protein